jgi:hypothetical protein
MNIKDTSFIKSFQCFRKKELPMFLYTAVFDLIFYFILILSIIIFMKYILPEAAFLFKTKSFVDGMQNMPMTSLFALGQEINNSLYTFGIFSGLILITLLSSFSFFKGLIWAKIFNEKFTSKKFLYLLVLNFSLLLFTILLFGFTSNYIVVSIQAGFFSFIVFPILVHIAHNANALLVLGKLNKFFKTTFKKIYLYIIPYIIIVGTAMLLLLFLSFIALTFKSIPFNIRIFINMLIFIAYFNWAKRYIGLIIKKAL